MAKWIRIALPIFVIASSIALGVPYFQKAVEQKRAWNEIAEFWSGLKIRWFLFDLDELHGALEKGNPDEWQTLVTRTALGRWRVQPTAPHAFSTLMEKMFLRGWWSCPDEAEWRDQLQKFDASWLRDRRRALRSRDHITSGDIVVGWQGGSTILYGCTRPRATAAVGSQLVFTYEAPVADVPNSPVTMHWRTAAAESIVGYRRRLGVVALVPGARPGYQRFTITYDMSWEPAWLAPGAHSPFVSITHERINRWTLISVEPGDSPFLPAE